MRIYIASSWKNATTVKNLAGLLRSVGHQVDCFADDSSGRYVFHFSEIENVDDLNAIDFLKDERSQKAFQEDRKFLDWCECVVLVLPSGKSAHLEAGYAKGRCKYLIIVGDFPKGEFDVMYGFADALIHYEDLSGLLGLLHKWDAKKPRGLKGNAT